ncbi:hypothetical protein BMG03_10560 [Thioclava nitratireducens]|uniref:Uncharacterized protein n=1 Tax=Thioclava nitratireducens TaxID=1915078 RepID=A0ABM6IH20_9RHOB|nr:hypothetical protein [Thioclava nitratireducens]AQS48190.1 hypothetical protein BMG03_10560 [Thioclava nitratireducens]
MIEESFQEPLVSDLDSIEEGRHFVMFNALVWISASFQEQCQNLFGPRVFIGCAAEALGKAMHQSWILSEALDNHICLLGNEWRVTWQQRSRDAVDVARNCVRVAEVSDNSFGRGKAIDRVV